MVGTEDARAVGDQGGELGEGACGVARCAGPGGVVDAGSEGVGVVGVQHALDVREQGGEPGQCANNIAGAAGSLARGVPRFSRAAVNVRVSEAVRSSWRRCGGRISSCRTMT